MVDVADKPNAAASLAVSKGVQRFADERSQARRFHRDTLGKDVDPEYSLGDFLLLVADRNDRMLEKRYGSYVRKAALSESSGIAGGYTVPPELRDDLMGDVADIAVVRKRATVVPMKSEILELPLWDTTTATVSGVAPFWGGLDFNYFSEAGTMSENEPKFRQLSLRANLIGGVLLVSAPLMQDALGLEAWLRRAFSGSLAWYEDWFAINGTGAGQPLGFLNAPCAIKVTRQTSNQYTSQDGQNLFAKLYDNSSVDRSVWLFSVTARSYLTAQSQWWINGPMKQYGLDLFGTMKQPPLGTQGDVIAVDCEMIVIGDRNVMEVAASPYYGTTFQQNQWMWRIAERVDIQPLLSAPVTVPDGAGTPNTVSPVVILH